MNKPSLPTRLLWASTAILVVVSVLLSGRVASDDGLLPNPRITPGVTNPFVTQSNIQTTICIYGWTKTVRPPQSYTHRLKVAALAGDYLYLAERFGTSTRNYQFDHLIPLELGGHPSDVRNLWPQPRAGFNAYPKNKIGHRLREMVCAGQLKLGVAQQMISDNWVTAYNKYMKGK